MADLPIFDHVAMNDLGVMFAQYLTKATSPIELLLGAGIFRAAVQERLITSETLPVSISRKRPGSEQGRDILVCDVGEWEWWAQRQVGRYVADFAFTKGKALLVVECDGHEFHERTKEQAEHDRQRDRWMLAEGFTVLRFTGSEIWKSPTACACEVLNALARIA